MQPVKVGEAQISDGGFTIEQCFTPEFKNYCIGGVEYVGVDIYPVGNTLPRIAVYVTKES